MVKGTMKKKREKPLPAEVAARKIVQICYSPRKERREFDTQYETVMALCDDGTVWQTFYYDGTWREWEQIPNVPQGVA
jgi:hypothetical protein